MKTVFKILIILIISGCSADRQFFGKYASPNSANAFQFKSNHTFLNEYLEGEKAKHSTGRWKRVSKDTIVISSAIQTLKVPLEWTSLDSCKTNRINLSIDLKIDSGLDLANYYCYVNVNNNVPFEGNRCNAISSLYINKPVYGINLVFTKVPHRPIDGGFPLETDTLKFDKPLSHDIKIKVRIKDSFFDYNPFNNVKIKTGKNSIELYNCYLDKWITIQKQPRSSHVFLNW
ncbi:MAG: hypothetical protein ACXVA2_03025 [Mucilaginibacter sp.]